MQLQLVVVAEGVAQVCLLGCLIDAFVLVEVVFGVAAYTLWDGI